MLQMQPHERIFVALDDLRVTENRKMVQALKGHVRGFKIGLKFLMHFVNQMATVSYVLRDKLATDFQSLIEEIGPSNLFLDFKFSDIPSTVEWAMLCPSLLNAKFCTVHANSGRRSIKAAVHKRGNTNILGVTVPTSMGDAEVMEVYAARRKVVVLRLARLAVESGVQGLVCAAQDCKVLKADPNLLLIPKMVPGIRPTWVASDDQVMTATPAEAIVAGAEWLVIGRPITEAKDPREAVSRIVHEIAEYAV